MERIRCPNPKCGRHILDIEVMSPGKSVLESPAIHLKTVKKRYIHFGGRTAVHDECGLQCARCFYLRLTRCSPLEREGTT